jgi:hypothetical protein
MAQEFLDGADIVTGLQQVRGKRVAKRVRSGGFGDTGRAYGCFHRSLQVLLIDVVAAFTA